MRAKDMTKNILIASIFLFGMCLNAQEKKLVWEENFDGKVLNEKDWNFELGDGCPKMCGWGNNEKQSYTRQNHRVEDGFLVITAKKKDSTYTSTRITTKGKKEFKYGRMEARLKLPIGKGVWPAFWMLGSNISEVGWPMCGEIDIMEYVGREPGTLFTTLHTKDSHGNSKNTRKAALEGIDRDFHTYAIEWTKSEISFFVDGEHFYTFEPEDLSEEVWPFDQPFYFILNLAIGGNFGGHDIDNSIFPVEYVIDYIRVYQN
jgi:beta-glucanase (GH16 family)